MLYLGNTLTALAVIRCYELRNRGFNAAEMTRITPEHDAKLQDLHTAMLRSLIPLAPRPGEDLQAQLDRLAELRGKQRELKRLEARLRREAQFNRKVALNRQVRALREALQALRAD